MNSFRQTVMRTIATFNCFRIYGSGVLMCVCVFSCQATCRFRKTYSNLRWRWRQLQTKFKHYTHTLCESERTTYIDMVNFDSFTFTHLTVSKMSVKYGYALATCHSPFICHCVWHLSSSFSSFFAKSMNMMMSETSLVFADSTTFQMEMKCTHTRY